MPITVTVDEARANLRELIANLAPDQEVVITDHEQPVAKLVPATEPPRKPRRPGTLRGTVRYMAPNVDAPLEDFKDYLECGTCLPETTTVG